MDDIALRIVGRCLEIRHCTQLVVHVSLRERGNAMHEYASTHQVMHCMKRQAFSPYSVLLQGRKGLAGQVRCVLCLISKGVRKFEGSMHAECSPATSRAKILFLQRPSTNPKCCNTKGRLH